MSKTKYAALNSDGDTYFQTFRDLEGGESFFCFPQHGVLGIVAAFLGDTDLEPKETLAIVKFGSHCSQISVKYLDFYELSSPVTPEEKQMVEMLGYKIQEPEQ